MISERTKAALQAKRAEGVRIGRRSTLAPEVVERIRSLRSAGCSLQLIADDLNAAGVPTGQGGSRWRPSSVAAVLVRAA